ncbi:unnamed protein product [Discosporangium mesarthrocarpum]
MSVTEDALFRAIEDMQAASKKPWGRFLDAGTGTHSLKWINTLKTDGFTAVTADRKFAETTRREVGFKVQDPNEIVLGNWRDEKFLEGRVFDTVLADYLVGAIDGFAPYFQDQIFERLKRHLAPGGRLYVVGMQPLPDHPGGVAELVCEGARLRDACILLAGHRCYREYPLDWIARQLKGSGFAVPSTRKMPVVYTPRTVKRQLDVASRKLPIIAVRDPGLAKMLEASISDLDGRVNSELAKNGGRVEVGFDYIVEAVLSEVEETPALGLANAEKLEKGDQEGMESLTSFQLHKQQY